MSFAGDREPKPELTTTRTGGGRRAWLIALAAVIVLGGAIYLGLSGPAVTPPRSPNPASPPALVAAATAVPARRVSFAPNEVESIRVDPTAPVHYQYLGTGLTLNGHGTLAILDPVADNEYRGIYRIPYALSAPTAHLEFDAVTASVSNDDLDRIGSWDFPIGPINSGQCCPSVTALDTTQPAQDKTLANPDFSRLATNGFRLLVTTQNETDAALMTIDVTVGPDQFFPDESYSVRAGPPDTSFALPLEKFAPGAYDGQALIPSSLLGMSVPVTLTAVPMSNPSLGPVEVGTWSIQVSAQRVNTGLDQIEEGGTPRPIAAGEPQILGNGFNFVVGQRLIGGDLYLVAELSIIASAVSIR